jgi:hypothetical protein
VLKEDVLFCKNLNKQEFKLEIYIIAIIVINLYSNKYGVNELSLLFFYKRKKKKKIF